MIPGALLKVVEKQATVRQPQWNIHEAVVLLAAYLEAQRKERPRAHIIRDVSAALRQMALNQGLLIDDIYRNENGISYQLQSMESAFRGENIYVPATKLFAEVVSLYNKNRSRFDSLLEEAREMIDQHNNKEAFLSWASSVMPEKQYKWIDDNLLYVEQYAQAKGLLCGSIYTMSDLSTLFAIKNAIGKDKIFCIKHRKRLQSIFDAFEAYIRFCTKENSKREIGTVPAKEETAFPQSESVDEVKSDNKGDSEMSRIQRILDKHYQYGFRYSSIREIMRFRQFAEAMGIELPENDGQLRDSIIASGIVIDDKVFCNSKSLPEELQNLVDEVFATGAETIYYECLLQNKSEWMEEHTITSEGILKEYLQKYVKGCSYAKKFMIRGHKKTEKQAVTEEIKRVWGINRTENVNKLSEKLPYIPLRNIWRVISGNDVFVLSSEGEYLLIDRFVISQDEIRHITDYVDAICEEKGFCSLTDVPLGDIAENNFDLSSLAIYNAIYKLVLAGKYCLNGKILTKDKPELDAVLLLKQHIKGKTECTFDEVAEKVVELIGGTNRQYAFQALYDEMVRVDKNRFVANNAVSFDVSEIDRVLATFISDHFVAIRDITTFAMFPLCGHNWNHYLLESFCYKYSRKYSLHVIHFNDKNAGIIAEKDFNKSYSEMLAIELARSDVELKTESVGTYLFNTGYMAKSKYAKLDDIVKRAKEIRKEG
jgi:hypothetical protein